MREEAEAAQAVIEADQDNAVLCKALSGIDRRRTSAIYEPAAVNPDHDGQLASATFYRRPDVHVKAIFTRRNSERCGVARKRQLHAVGTVFTCVANSRPRVNGLWWAPAILLDRRGCERNAFEGGTDAVDEAFQLSGVDLN